MNTMKSIFFETTGAPEDVLQVKDIPIPDPGNNEVLVRLLASPINPADVLFINGRYRITPRFPQIAGLEGVGIIEKVGKNLNYEAGTLVAFRHKGVWAEYAVIPVDRLIILPKNFPVEKGSQLALNPITAYALLDQANMKINDWLLLTGGTSAVSKIIIQLAKLKNINTIVMVRKDDEAKSLKQLGVAEVISIHSEKILEKILEITNGRGVTCLLDAVGGPLLSELINIMALKGQIISYGLMDAANVTYHNSAVIFKNLTIRGFGIDAWLENNTEKKKEAFDFLINTIVDEEFKMPVAAKFSLVDYQSAFNLYQSGVNHGKILLTSAESTQKI